MTPQLQSVLALIVVAVAVTWMIARTLAKRKKPGCGGDCGCPPSEFKAKLKP
jgi:hypothetical protein